MSRLVTKEDVTVNFRNYGEIVVPKGTLLTNKTADGEDETVVKPNDNAEL